MSAFWQDAKKPIIIAHRGGAGLYSLGRHRRENTLEVFRAAIGLGYKYLEIDVTNSADSQVIILHVTADRFEALLHKPGAPDAQKLQKYTHAQLKELLGRDIPTLESVLKSFPTTRFLIDAKTDEVVEPLAKIIKKTKAKNRVYLNSFFYKRIIKLQQLLGQDINCGIIIGRHPRLFNQRLRALNRGDYFDKGFTAITIPRRYLSQKRVDLIHQHGLKVLVWTPNTQPQIKKAVSLGVDGIISDRIELLKSLVRP